MSTPQANSQTLTPQEQIDMAGQVRQAKSGGGEESEAREEQGADQPKSLREKVMAARRAMDIKQRAKDKIQEKITMPAEKTFKAALRWAWMITFSVIGFLPGLFYINLHAFLRLIFPSFFCELGKEWQPEQSKNNVISATRIGASIGEKALLAFLDVMMLMIFAILYAVLAWVYENSILSWALEKILL
ncbi:hypothetical protein L6267_00340 [Candidatus Parcubacteria bacterium]|nr:hypothetical protein [Candidatus Parcubacteria bacterium]